MLRIPVPKNIQMSLSLITKALRLRTSKNNPMAPAAITHRTTVICSGRKPVDDKYVENKPITPQQTPAIATSAGARTRQSIFIERCIDLSFHSTVVE